MIYILYKQNNTRKNTAKHQKITAELASVYNTNTYNILLLLCGINEGIFILSMQRTHFSYLFTIIIFNIIKDVIFFHMI